MKRNRRVKILATLGPASSEADVIEKLFHAGADVFRINMSHSSHDRMRELVSLIRAAEQDYNRPIGILADLQGPKLRVGAFGGGRVHLQTGQGFRLDLNATPGDARRGNLPHPEIIAAVAARKAKAPVKITYTREEVFWAHRGRPRPSHHPRHGEEDRRRSRGVVHDGRGGRVQHHAAHLPGRAG